LASHVRSSVAALRYASALIDIAEDNKVIPAVDSNLQALQTLLTDSQDFRDFTKSPLISRAQKKNALEQISQKVQFDKITENFLFLLAQNNRLNILPGIIGAFQSELLKRRNEMAASVETAFPLSKAQEKDIQDSLTQAMGNKVNVSVSVNKDLIGGMVVTIGSKMIDDSVKRKLERLQIAMKGGANSNSEGEKAA